MVSRGAAGWASPAATAAADPANSCHRGAAAAGAAACEAETGRRDAPADFIGIKISNETVQQ